MFKFADPVYHDGAQADYDGKKIRMLLAKALAAREQKGSEPANFK